MPLRLLALPLLLSLVSCQPGAPAHVDAPADSAAGTLRFRMAGPGGVAMVVPVHVNGRGPYDFVLDTGATLTCLDAALADSLRLPAAVGQIGFGATVSGTGAMRLVRLDSLRVGNARAASLSACALDLASFRTAGLHARGLLGLNFLRQYHVSIDFKRRQLTLQAPKK